MEKILIVVGAILLIVAVTEIAPRIRVPAALALVVIGAAIGIMPIVPALHLDPEWILVGVLPPLLYAAAVQMPAMEFRRDFGTISALSVLLVLVSALALGFFFWAVVPGIGLATGVALGAIVSPTDAVATSIAKKLGVPSRVTAVLEGESMLNDATSLVLLRAAIAATAATISFWGVLVNFAYAVVLAVAIGAVVGMLNLRVRARVHDPAVNTAISFTVPFLAYLPTEELGASGLVAAVTAGLITGAGATRFLTPRHRISDTQNWRMVAMLAEGGVFFLMGLELFGLMGDVVNEHNGVQHAVWLGLAALGVALAIRAVYIVPLVWWVDRRRQRGEAMRPILENYTATATAGASKRDDARVRRRFTRWRRRFHLRRHPDPDKTSPTTMSPETAGRINARITRALADIDYYDDAPLGRKEGVIMVWAGLRGVVTVAAAQTLPDDTHSRSLLVLTAFVVAAASLLLQGGTLSWLIRRLRLPDTVEDKRAERLRLRADMDATMQTAMAQSEVVREIPWLRVRIEQATREAEDIDEGDVEDGDMSDGDRSEGANPGPVMGTGATYGLNLAERAQMRAVRREIIAVQRARLLSLRREGSYSSEALSRVLNQLDAEEISLDLQGG
ncbi:sodium:proton antiporter [Gordonia polyisoprenivorans]|uniref:cation:proton antiporter n=1 Tax=Gordonia polyisoprenivorans TaxID=84595 RepID=UPI00039BC702|nr:sodium:proton antiporter [Gordonia polyisoprenivorans]UZF57754.1 sodium:proton antiporter [Gordonia polyisoprenivorans]